MGTSYSKKHKAGISVLSGLTAAILLLTGCSQPEETVYQIPEDKKLIVYTAHKADVYEPIIKEFEERTGIFVELPLIEFRGSGDFEEKFQNRRKSQLMRIDSAVAVRKYGAVIPLCKRQCCYIGIQLISLRGTYDGTDPPVTGDAHP